jgi:predicted AAA+ superfamily ATPase
MSKEFLFSQMTLPAELVEDLRRQNPWWEQRALPELPPYHRHWVRQIQRRLEWKLAPVVVVRGPRQIGKTTAQLHWIEKAINNAPFGLLIMQDDSPGIFDPRIVALPLSSLMLLR